MGIYNDDVCIIFEVDSPFTSQAIDVFPTSRLHKCMFACVCVCACVFVCITVNVVLTYA